MAKLFELALFLIGLSLGILGAITLFTNAFDGVMMLIGALLFLYLSKKAQT